MKDITELKVKLESAFAKKFCKVDSVTQCPNGDTCTCSIAAETQAYLRSVIPDPYYKYTIHNFDGRSIDGTEELVDGSIALKAKESLVNYCWEGLSLDDINHKELTELDKFSAIKKRKLNCTNVVIHADSMVFGEQRGSPKPRPRGKTMCASIIMKEAIKSRTNGGRDYSQTFDWVGFSILENLLRYPKDNENAIVNIRTADWLVVDDINSSAKSYSGKIVDPFFLERLQDRLPTIFVCRFNVFNKFSEDALGVAITKIINDPKTCFITLSK